MGAVWVAVIAAWGSDIIVAGSSFLKDIAQSGREQRVHFVKQRTEAYARFGALGSRYVFHDFWRSLSLEGASDSTSFSVMQEFGEAFQTVRLLASQPGGRPRRIISLMFWPL
jgi:hypothetical protein